MAEILFISPEEIAATTIMGGNVDQDNYIFSIANVQITTIEPLLGSELYDVIVAGVTADNLTGLYLELYTEYIKPITKFHATAKYISVASYTLANGGLFKHQPDNKEIVSKEEADGLANEYNAMGQMYVIRFEKWIGLNPLTEYKTSQDDVNAQDLKLTGGWYL